MKNLRIYVVILMSSLYGCNKGHQKQSAPEISQSPPPAAQSEADRSADRSNQEKLINAAGTGDIEGMKALLAQGVPISSQSEGKFGPVTPLLAAIANGHRAAALFLLQSGALPVDQYAGYSAYDFAVLVFGEQNEVTNLIASRINHRTP